MDESRKMSLRRVTVIAVNLRFAHVGLGNIITNKGHGRDNAKKVIESP